MSDATVRKRQQQYHNLMKMMVKDFGDIADWLLRNQMSAAELENRLREVIDLHEEAQRQLVDVLSPQHAVGEPSG